MITSFRVVIAAAVAAMLVVAARADVPHLYAITGARIVPVAGPPIASGTVVIRGSAIEAVGANVPAPAGAVAIEGRGLTVYPGLIDLGTTAGVDVPGIPAPQNPQTTLEQERWKRSSILRPQVEAARFVTVDGGVLDKFAAAGVTTVLAVPPGEVVAGHSALVSVAAPPDRPQIGQVADERRGTLVVRTPVALHIEFTSRPRGAGYPNSLMGVIAFVRQTFLDAQHYEQARSHYERVKTGERPPYDPALEALQPALTGRVPVAFRADAEREILRALALAGEFGLRPLIAGAREADRVVADLKAGDARVVFSLDYPTRPRALAPDADESLRVLRERAQAPKTPAALHQANVAFAFASAGLREPADFVRNAARAVREGLPADAALRALTIDAAGIAGAADRLGTLEPGKLASLIVTDGDLFEEETRIRHVFVEGRPVDIEAVAEPRPGERRGRPAGTSTR